MTAHQQPEAELGLRLDSWKQIAAYLNRHLTTVRRWERGEGLPVHRHVHSRIGTIYAWSKELDAWLLTRRSPFAADDSTAIAAIPENPPYLLPAAGSGTPGVSGIREGSVRLLGREAEFEALEKIWNRSRNGARELVLITGEPGAGKTRLVFDFASSISRHANVFAGRCDPSPHLPFTPFVEILQGIRQSVPPKILSQGLGEIEGSIELANLAADFTRLIRPAAASAPATPEGRRFRMFEAFTELVRWLARSSPVFLVIEDLQWADEGSMLLLRYLIRSARDAALCIVVTCCDTELEKVRWSAEMLADLRRETSAARIELAGLAEDRIQCFVEEWMGESAPANLVRFVAGITQGNPLFLTEMLRHLSETGTAARIRALGPHADWAASGLPVSIGEAVGRRLARLSQPCTALLVVASVAGREFSLSIAAEVARLPEDLLLDAVDEAVAADILRELAGSPERFSFAHPITREVIYSRQTAARRVRLHLKLAEALERHSDPGDLPFAELACHFGHALAHGGSQKALDYAILAGERAMASLAFEEAGGYYKRALDALGFLPPNAENSRKRFDLHLSRGRCLSQAGHWESAKKDLEAAVRLTATGDQEGPAELYVKLAEASFWVLDISGVRHYAEKAEQFAGKAGRADLSADALAWRASAQAADGDVTGALELDRRAIARAGGIRSFALARTPLTLYWAGQGCEAAEKARQAVKWARASGDAAFLLYALQHQGLALAGIGEYEKSVHVFDEACTFGRLCGALPLLARAMCMSVAPLLSVGDLHGARMRALEARELAHSVAFEPPLVSAGIDLLIIHARLRDPGRSETLFAETQAAVEQARGWHGWKWRLRLAQAQAELALARERWDEAITAATCVIDRSRSHSRPKYEALGLASRARAAGRLGSRRAGRDALAAVQIARRLGDPAVLLECLSVLLELDGADDLLTEAQHTVRRISGALAEGPLQRRFLASLPSRRVAEQISHGVDRATG